MERERDVKLRIDDAMVILSATPEDFMCMLARRETDAKDVRTVSAFTRRSLDMGLLLKSIGHDLGAKFGSVWTDFLANKRVDTKPLKVRLSELFSESEERLQKWREEEGEDSGFSSQSDYSDSSTETTESGTESGTESDTETDEMEDDVN